MRHECPNLVFTQSTGRNYATAVHTPAVSKAGQGAVDRPQVQGRREAVDKSPLVPNTEEVSLQCGQVDHGGDTEVNQMSADDDDDELCACDRIMMMVKLDSSL